MPNDKKYFSAPDGRLNSDDLVFAIGQNEWVNRENFRSSTTDNDGTGAQNQIGGNVLISPAQPSVTFITLGAVEDTENGRFLKFNFNTTGTEHKIICCYTNTGTEYTVLLSSQVTGGLNFNKNSLIHSAKIVNGYLYWPDGTNNQPRKINIDAGIVANDGTFVTSAVPYIFPLNFSEITLIKHPPALAPNITKSLDSGFLNNFIANDSFEFAFQYIWYDNEETVIGAYSVNSRLNKPTDTWNYIKVSMDITEVIPNSVRIVNLIVRYDGEENGLPTNLAKVVKTWDKLISAESAQIAAQNAGTTALRFDFYNNITGQALSPDNVLRICDTVPIYSQTMEAFRNRIGLANNTEGYNTPKTTSLANTLITTPIGGSTLTKNLISIKQRRLNAVDPLHDWHYVAWFVYLTEVSPPGFYAVTSTEQSGTGSGQGTYPSMPLPSSPIAFSGLTFRGADFDAVLTATQPGGTRARTRSDYLSTSNLVSITGIGVSTYDVFKSRSSYRDGVQFFDFGLRPVGGCVTNDGLVISIPPRNYNYTTGVNAIAWSLSNANAVNEIPDEAYYYAVVRTLNLLTRFFIDAFTNAAKYATKDVDGNYVFTSNLYTTTTVGIGINTATLNQAGLGYIFSEGDICVLTKSDNTSYTLPVIGQIDNYILLKAQDIGTLDMTQFVFDIYTPYQSSVQEPYYVVGEMYRVTNPTLSNRTYEVLGDIFVPDAYVLTRNYQAVTYFAEAMSPNDVFYKRWDNDSGKPTFVTKLGQSVKTQYISWSDTFIPNTAVNGLSTFRPLNQKPLPEDCGAIRKLQLTSKVQAEQGVVMLAICTVETASLYIGEVQITDSTGQTQFFSQSDQIIGTINILKGSYGTLNPESVIEYRGLVFFADANNRKWIQYSANGLDPISNYKMQRFWNLWFAQFNSMTAAQIEALGGRPFIFTAVDAYHKELLISIPKLSNMPPKGYLPDYPEVVYPFDILDFQEKVMVYKLQEPERLPHWAGAFTFYVENFVTLQNKLYSFKNGLSYLHNQANNYNNFFGVQYKSRIMFTSNIIPQVPKVYDNISVESNYAPTFVYMYNSYPIQQSTDLVDYEFRPLEGIWYSTVKRNKLQPTAVGFTSTSLLSGEKMRNVSMLIMLEFTVSSTPVELKFVQIGVNVSLGHSNYLNK